MLQPCIKPPRKNPLPTVHEDQGNGTFLLLHGEPQDLCPVSGCGSRLRFLHR